MLNNYAKTSIRNLLRHKTSSVIHIAGLMVGIAAFLLIFLVVGYEKSFDNYHPDKENIYRVVRIGRGANPSYRTGVPAPVTLTLRDNYPQLKEVGAMMPDGNVQVIVRDSNGAPIKKIREGDGIYFVEPQILHVLHFTALAGNPETALATPGTVVLAKDMAVKYFGDWRTAIGRTIHFDDLTLKVTSIIDNPPANTDFPVRSMIPYSTLAAYMNMKNWGSISDENYCMIKLAPGTTETQFDQSLLDFTDKYIKPVNNGYFLTLQPLSGVHYDARYGNYNGRVFSKDLILALELIGLFLLVIACVNFINLTTAQAVNRSREVGVRKVLGSSRAQLMMQTLAETGLTTALALLGAETIVALCLPAVNKLLDITLSEGMLWTPGSIAILALSWLGVTLLSGFYPALVLSGFKPVAVLKNTLTAHQTKGISFRRVLVVFQFVIAQTLIIGTLVIAAQMDYFRTADLGFHKDAVINADFPTDSLSMTKVGLLHNLLTAIPGIANCSFSSNTPGTGGNYSDLRTPGWNRQEPQVIVNIKTADTAFFRLYSLEFVAGRPYFPSDTIREFVVNESTARKLGYAHPADAIGKPIQTWGKTGPIVGVVKDFHTNSLRDPIDPVVFFPFKWNYQIASLKIDMTHAGSTIAAIKKVWDQVFPDYSFDYQFLDDRIASFYQQENELSVLYKIFSGIAIFISCLGLYGLIAFMAVQRRKEIGIRKVLGASIPSIVRIMSSEFTILIGVAFLIAGPIAWYLMHQWLQQYTYRIPMGAGFFVMTLVASIIIAWLTVGYTAVKAALANPVNSLRTE
jgi:putative ABC transport system permease protein